MDINTEYQQRLFMTAKYIVFNGRTFFSDCNVAQVEIAILSTITNI